MLIVWPDNNGRRQDFQIWTKTSPVFLLFPEEHQYHHPTTNRFCQTNPASRTRFLLNRAAQSTSEGIKQFLNSTSDHIILLHPIWGNEDCSILLKLFFPISQSDSLENEQILFSLLFRKSPDRLQTRKYGLVVKLLWLHKTFATNLMFSLLRFTTLLLKTTLLWEKSKDLE